MKQTFLVVLAIFSLSLISCSSLSENLQEGVGGTSGEVFTSSDFENEDDYTDTTDESKTLLTDLESAAPSNITIDPATFSDDVEKIYNDYFGGDGLYSDADFDAKLDQLLNLDSEESEDSSESSYLKSMYDKSDPVDAGYFLFRSVWGKLRRNKTTEPTYFGKLESEEAVAESMEPTIWRIVIIADSEDVVLKGRRTIKFEKNDRKLNKCNDDQHIEFLTGTLPHIDGAVSMAQVPKTLTEAKIKIMKVKLVLEDEKILCYNGNEDKFEVELEQEFTLNANSEEIFQDKKVDFIDEEHLVGLRTHVFMVSEERVGGMHGRIKSAGESGIGTFHGFWRSFEKKNLHKHGRMRGIYFDYENSLGETLNIFIGKYVIKNNDRTGEFSISDWSFGGFLIGNLDFGDAEVDGDELFNGYYLTRSSDNEENSGVTVGGILSGSFENVTDELGGFYEGVWKAYDEDSTACENLELAKAGGCKPTKCQIREMVTGEATGYYCNVEAELLE